MVTTEPFIATMRRSDNYITLGGTPGDDIGGYRVAIYNGTTSSPALVGVYVVPAPTVLDASGLWSVDATGTGGTAFALLKPNVDPNAAADRLEFRGIGLSATPTTGPCAGIPVTDTGIFVTSSQLEHVGRVGSGTPADPFSNTGWALLSGYLRPHAGFDYPRIESTVPVEPEEPETPVDPEISELTARTLAFLGQTGNTAISAQAQEIVTGITYWAKAYTRGKGFVDGAPRDEVGSVIVSASARLLANPDQIRAQIGAVSIYSNFEGWAPLEKILLDSIRGRAA